MGDRANVVVKTGNEQVCLYTHWCGSDLPDILRAALKRGKDRWTDSQYLTRIIFCEMVKSDAMGTTGFGISQSIGDGSDRVLWVDVRSETVQVNGRAPVSFVDFVAGNVGWD